MHAVRWGASLSLAAGPVLAHRARLSSRRPCQLQACLRAHTRCLTAAPCSCASSEEGHSGHSVGGSGEHAYVAILHRRLARVLRGRAPSVRRLPTAAGWTALQTAWCCPTASWSPHTTRLSRRRVGGHACGEGKAGKGANETARWCSAASAIPGTRPVVAGQPGRSGPLAANNPPLIPMWAISRVSAGTIKWRMAHPPDAQRSALQGLAYAGGIGEWAGGLARFCSAGQGWQGHRSGLPGRIQLASSPAPHLCSPGRAAVWQAPGRQRRGHYRAAGGGCRAAGSQGWASRHAGRPRLTGIMAEPAPRARPCAAEGSAQSACARACQTCPLPWCMQGNELIAHTETVSGTFRIHPGKGRAGPPP